jgi:hypothetical protein
MTFYRWALNRGILGFDKETYLALKEIKTRRLDPGEWWKKGGLDRC